MSFFIPYLIPANVPTDFSRIIDFGVYKLYEKTKNEKIVAIPYKHEAPFRVLIAFPSISQLTLD